MTQKRNVISVTICFLMVTMAIFFLTHSNMIFSLAHSTPELSIRTKLFTTGHPIAAFIISVQPNTFQYNLDKELLDKENSKIYRINGYYANVVVDNGTYIFNFKVKKERSLYFADYWGQM